MKGDPNRPEEGEGSETWNSECLCNSARTYSTPMSAGVFGELRIFIAASSVWSPEIEIELYFGISAQVYAKMSEMIRMRGLGR